MGEAWVMHGGTHGGTHEVQGRENAQWGSDGSYMQMPEGVMHVWGQREAASETRARPRRRGAGLSVTAVEQRRSNDGIFDLNRLTSHPPC